MRTTTKSTKLELTKTSIRVIGCAVEVDRHPGKIASNASFSDSFVFFVVK